MNNNILLLSKHRSALMGVAILWIMLYHIPAKGGIPIITQILEVGYGGVDIFLFLSGFGLFFSLSNKDTTLPQYYKKRFLRILPEFWIFLIVDYVATMDFNMASLGELLYKATTIGYWIPGTPYDLWYVSCILFFYLIFPFYFRAFESKGISAPVIAILLGFILILVYAIIMVAKFDNKNVGGLIILTVSRIPIFFIGSVFGYFAKYNVNIFKVRMIRVISMILFFLAIISLFIFVNYFQNYLWTCSLYWLPYIVITPVLCIILAWLFDRFPNIINRVFTKVGSISFELYVMHIFVFEHMEKILSDNFGTHVSMPAILMISFVLAFALYRVNMVLETFKKKSVQRLYKIIL